MKRRSILGTGLALAFCPDIGFGFDRLQLENAGKILADAAKQGEVRSSALYVRQGADVFSQTYGLARDTDAMFLLASISKTISIAAEMTLYDEGHFRMDDRVQRYIPEFRGEGREKITVGQLMTHVSGLPDQLPENSRLRAAHAPLDEFVAAAIKTPLLFEPGTRYGYTFGHTGSTGTICWADPSTDSICVVLTTLPYCAVSPHPRDHVAAQVARALETRS